MPPPHDLPLNAQRPVPVRSRLFLVLLVSLPVVAMLVSLLVPSGHRGQPADPRAEKLTEAGNILAWSMLGLLTVLCGLTVAWVFHLRRLARNPDPGLALLDELYQAELPGRKLALRPDAAVDPISPKDESPETPANSWEKPGDWWKKT